MMKISAGDRGGVVSGVEYAMYFPSGENFPGDNGRASSASLRAEPSAAEMPGLHT